MAERRPTAPNGGQHGDQAVALDQLNVRVPHHLPKVLKVANGIVGGCPGVAWVPRRVHKNEATPGESHGVHPGACGGLKECTGGRTTSRREQGVAVIGEVAPEPDTPPHGVLFVGRSFERDDNIEPRAGDQWSLAWTERHALQLVMGTERLYDVWRVDCGEHEHAPPAASEGRDGVGKRGRHGRPGAESLS